jgi:enoyl-CoA hydratase/carnithine racemase/ferredoxin
MLHVEDADRVRLVTLDRPAARNALDTEHYHALADALDGAATATDLAVVTLTGTAGAFCAGQDLAEMGRLADTGTSTADRTGHGFQRFVVALSAFPKPIVAAVNGLAVGLGVTMLPYCDLVLAADDARFRTPFVSLGVVPEAGSSFTLPTLLGPQAAAHALLTGAWLDAADAHRRPRHGPHAARLARRDEAAAAHRLDRRGYRRPRARGGALRPPHRRARQPGGHRRLLREARPGLHQPGTRVESPARGTRGDDMAWKVVVDFDVCESNAICMGVAPEVFEVRDDDFLYLLQDKPSDDLRPKVEQAVRQCPKQAISIVEE